MLRILLLGLVACLVTGCETVTEHYFTGTLITGGVVRSVEHQKAPQFLERSTPETLERRYSIQPSNCVLMIRTPRLINYKRYTICSPSNSFGVYIAFRPKTDRIAEPAPAVAPRLEH